MAKGDNIMSNRKFTSDTVGGFGEIVGSTDNGGDSMLGSRDRKGGDVMTNSRLTSDMTGEYDHVERKGGSVMTNRHLASNMTGGYDLIGAEKVVDVATVRYAKAMVSMDNRIAKSLKMKWALGYRAAIAADSMSGFNAYATPMLLAMVSDTGLAGIVESVAAVDREFGGLGLMQRAIARRLEEKRKSLGG